MKRPFVFIGSVMFIIILLLSCLNAVASAVIFLLSAILAVACFFIGKKIKFFRIIFIIFLGVSLACSSYTFKTKTEYLPAISHATDKQSVVSGTLIDSSDYNGFHYYTLDNISINNENTKHRIKITSTYFTSAKIDDILTFTVTDIDADSPVPAFYLPDADGVHLHAYSNRQPEHEEAISHSARYYLRQFRDFISDTVSSNMDDNYAGAVNAMMTGDKSMLSEDVQQTFSHSGISHLFAVSGFHLSLWTSMIFLIFNRLHGRKRIIGNVFSLIFVIFFMALTGFTESVVRSGLMMIIFLVGNFIKYRSDSLNSLFVALSIILFINPYSATSTSLQMSFFATLGIISLSSPVAEWFIKLKDKIKPKPLYKALFTLYMTAMVSLIATVFTCPVSAVNFGYYSAVAPLTNILCLPVAQLILPLSSIGIATSVFPVVSKIPFMLCSYIMKYILFVSEKMSSLPHATIDAHAYAVRILLFTILFITIILIFIFENNNNHLRKVTSFMISCFVAVSVFAIAAEQYTVNIYVSDVGNGSAVVCNFHGKKIILGCGGHQYREYVFKNTINSIAYKNFDLLLIPRNTTTESAYANSLLSDYSFKDIIICDEKLSDATEDSIPVNTQRASELNIKIDEKTNLVYINNSKFTGVRIQEDDFSCTVIFKSSVDFSAVPSYWMAGDLLITRQKLPDIDLSGFNNIFISTNAKTIYDAENIYSTRTDGNLTYITTFSRGEKIYADK